MPAGAHAGDDLPVMVYVHGGGGFSGANSDWWCDGGSIVKRSLEIGKPIIMVAIKYESPKKSSSVCAQAFMLMFGIATVLLCLVTLELTNWEM